MRYGNSARNATGQRIHVIKMSHVEQLLRCTFPGLHGTIHGGIEPLAAGRFAGKVERAPEWRGARNCVRIDTAGADPAVGTARQRIVLPVVPVPRPQSFRDAVERQVEHMCDSERSAVRRNVPACRLPTRATCVPAAHPASTGASIGSAVHQVGSDCDRSWTKSTSSSCGSSFQNGASKTRSTFTAGPVASCANADPLARKRR